MKTFEDYENEYMKTALNKSRKKQAKELVDKKVRLGLKYKKDPESLSEKDLKSLERKDKIFSVFSGMGEKIKTNMKKKAIENRKTKPMGGVFGRNRFG